MLYKNDEVQKLNQKEIEAVEKYFHGKFPVKVIYPQGRIVPSKLKHNRQPDKPNSISFDLKSVVKTNNGTEVWRYADQVVADNKGTLRYIPKKFGFNGTRYLDRKDIELIYFLLNKSSYCEGGKNQGKMVKFAFEDLVTEAEKKAEKKELESKIGVLLYNKELGLPEERLRLVARAYFIKNVDDMTLSQVKNVLEGRINSTKDGPDKFFDMVNADEELDARASLQKAVDQKLIIFDVVKKTWSWNLPDGKKMQICKVPPTTRTPNDAIYDIYKGDESFREDLKASLLSKKVKTGKGGDNIDPEE